MLCHAWDLAVLFVSLQGLRDKSIEKSSHYSKMTLETVSERCLAWDALISILTRKLLDYAALRA